MYGFITIRSVRDNNEMRCKKNHVIKNHSDCGVLQQCSCYVSPWLIGIAFQIILLKVSPKSHESMLDIMLSKNDTLKLEL